MRSIVMKLKLNRSLIDKKSCHFQHITHQLTRQLVVPSQHRFVIGVEPPFPWLKWNSSELQKLWAQKRILGGNYLAFEMNNIE